MPPYFVVLSETIHIVQCQGVNRMSLTVNIHPVQSNSLIVPRAVKSL